MELCRVATISLVMETSNDLDVVFIFILATVNSDQTRDRSDWQLSADWSSVKSVNKRILISKVRNKEGETTKTRQGIANVFAKFYEDLYENEEDNTEKGTDSRTDNDGEETERNNSIKEFTTNEIQHAIDRLKKGKAKDSNGIRAGQLRNCSDDTKEKSGPSSMKLCSRKTSHQNVAERSVSRSSTKKETERMQAITGQFAACQLYISCSQQFCMPGLHLVCTKYNLQNRQDFGLTIDVKTTLRCTGCWSNIVVSEVYRCTSARSTSRKHSTVSNIRRYGASCGSMESSQHT